MYPVVEIDGRKIVNLKAGGYSYAHLEPGSHRLSLFESAVLSPDAKKPYHEVEFTVQAGDVLYFKWSLSGDMVNPYYVDWVKNASFVSEDVGSAEIQSCKLLPPLADVK